MSCRSPVGTASMIVAVAPALSALSAALLFRERLSPAGVAGSAGALSGAAVIAVAGGDTGYLTAAAVQTAYHLGVEPLLRTCTGLEAASHAMWAGTVLLLPLAPGALGAVLHRPARRPARRGPPRRAAVGRRIPRVGLRSPAARSPARPPPSPWHRPPRSPSPTCGWANARTPPSCRADRSPSPGWPWPAAVRRPPPPAGEPGPARGRERYDLSAARASRVGGRYSRTYVRSQHAPVSRNSRQVV
nr:hypothetical protein [Streptomyces hygroscopicus]